MTIYSKSIEENNNTIGEDLIEALQTIPYNAAGLVDALTDPLGLSLAEIDEVENMAENQGVSTQLFGILQEKFVNGFAAYAYLLFVLLYFPCVTVIATIAKETGKQWALFSATYSTGIAYLIASCFYQIVTFTKNPTFSSLWLVSCAAILFGFYYSLKRHANKPQNKVIPLNIQ